MIKIKFCLKKSEFCEKVRQKRALKKHDKGWLQKNLHVGILELVENFNE